MSTNRSSGSRASWNKGRGDSPKKRRGDPLWRRPEEPGESRPPSRLFRIGRYVLGFLVCCGLIGWLISLLLPPQPAYFALIGAGYEDNLTIPHNVYGHNGLAGLAALAQTPRPRPFGRAQKPGYLIKERDLRVKSHWETLVEDLVRPFKEETAKEKTVVVFLSLHGGSDSTGGYVLLDSPQPGGEKIRLEEVLDAMTRLPKEKNKLLILDCTQLTDHWRLGMLHNNFARALEDLDSKIAMIPGLWVLSASDKDQRSCVSERWHQTVFSHYVLEGLSGKASQDDKRVNLWDLCQYVQKNVAEWSWENRGVVQTPVLLPRMKAQGKTLFDIDLTKKMKDVELTVALSGTTTTNPAQSQPSPADVEPADLWSHYEDLRTQVPSPAVYAPVLWRRYRAFLVRCDQLIRAADLESERRLRPQLDALEREIGQARVDKLSNSRGNSLAMMVAEGSSIPDPDKARDQFERVWEDEKQDFDKALKAVLSGSGGDKSIEDPLPLRMSLYDFLLQRAEEDPKENLKKVCSIALALERSGSLAPRPAEIHFLAMLMQNPSRDPASPRYQDVAKRAIQIRRLAEQTALAVEPDAAPYCAQIYPWIRKLVAEGDEARRRGEDLLFASSDSWNQSETHFQQAFEKYRQAVSRSTEVRKALSIRDRLVSELPDYSMWAARRHANRDKREGAGEDPLQTIEVLWKETHSLIKRLEEPGADSIPPRAEPVEEMFQTVVAEFEQNCERITKSTPSGWDAIEAALDVPSLSRSRRVRLREMQRDSGKNETDPQREADSAAKSAASKQAQDESGRLAIAHGRAQGRTAMALLGQPWFDDQEEKGSIRYEGVLDSIKSPDEDRWWVSFAKAGEQVGERFRRLPGEIDRLIGVSTGTDAEEARAAVRDAERLAWQLDGAIPLSSQPAQQARRWRLHNLLLGLEERTWLDHWFSDVPDAEPYYHRAGMAYLEDATKRVLRSTEVAHAKEKLDRPGKLRIVGLSRLALTSEIEQVLTYKIEPVEGAEIPPGLPVIQAEPGRELELARPESAKWAAHEQKDGPSFVVKSPILRATEKDKPPATTRAKPSALAVRGFFRGQFFETQTSIELYPRAEVVRTERKSAPRGTLAVRADDDVFKQFGDSDGNVVIVLDCSGSMSEPKDASGKDTFQKYKDATKALRQVLRRISRGTRVSLWIFSAEQDTRKTPFPFDGVEVEESIVRLCAPEPWDPDGPRVDELMRKVESRTPWTHTPLVRAMLKAKDDFNVAQGFQTLLVLTDGADDRFVKKDLENRMKKSIPTTLKEAFGSSGIQISIVCFKANDEEEKEARKQFSVIETFPSPGKFYTINDVEKLTTTLVKALKRKLHYQVETAKSERIAGKAGHDLIVSRSSVEDNWFRALDSGGYNVVIQTNKRTEKSFTLDSGDRLLLKLVTSPVGDIDIVRALFSVEDYPRKPSEQSNGWRLAVLQDQQIAPNRLQMLATLEALVKRGETSLRQFKPREVWMELKPQLNQEDRFALHWGNMEGYPAPAWRLDVPEWPRDLGTGGPARPALRVWWNPDQEPPWTARLEKPTDFQDPLQLRNRERKGADGESTTIESVSVEDHRVEVEPDRYEEQSCLVIRMSHAPNKPVWVRPRGIDLAGLSDHFYTSANKYTGLFWPITEDGVKKDLDAIDVYLLEEFKREAVKRGFHIEMQGLTPPDSSDRPPRTIPLDH